ncbi:MAG: epoxyqueuosine reductase QueH [Firmicutes bacterium]|nr:epoxyqueuosine reductase QueH [Bacillota bacterium]
MKTSKETLGETAILTGEQIKPLPAGSLTESLQRPALLLHSCCGPCSTAVIERLADEFEITVFYYNPCITDEEEYLLRRENQKKFLQEFNEERIEKNRIRFLEGAYHPGAFLKLVKGHEQDPEGGERCSLCFAQRLEKTAETAQMTGCDYFGTTLTVSPHKNYRRISEIGQSIALRYGLTFLDRDFKKKDGFKRSIELSRRYGLYRQDYCGCEFSKR